MTEYVEVTLGEFFEPVNGRAKFIRDYMDAHPGSYPVYSASLTEPFGYVDGFEYDGTYLTWVMNGYGGRVQEVSGQFSATRDRGVFVPRPGIQIPDLTYLRFAAEPQLIAAAVGRRVDGRLNEYTKIYPDVARDVSIQLPVGSQGEYDYEKIAELGAKFRRIEAAQKEVTLALDPLLRAAFEFEVPEPRATMTLGDSKIFVLSIGKRVLRSEHSESGVPVYSANALAPFGKVSKSNLSDFSKPSLLWGIDGNFDWNLIPADQEFATTDHCGRLQILDEKVDPVYLYCFLQATRGRYGFDRVFRASLQNMKAEVAVTIPLDPVSGEFSLERQWEIARKMTELEESRRSAVTSLEDVRKVRISVAL